MPDVTLAPLLAASGGPAPATHAIPKDPAIAASAAAEWQAHLAAGRIGIVPPGRSAEREAHYRQIDRITGKQG